MRNTLYKARKAQGLTQKEVANHIGISRRMYCSIELGNRNPSAKVINKLEDLFGLPQRQLLALDENDPETDSLAYFRDIVKEQNT